MIVPSLSVRLPLAGFAALLFALLSSGCETNKLWYRAEPEVEVSASPVVPPAFLYTDFPALNNWLDDERFRVEYRNLTPSLVFEQKPINQINYEMENMPPDTVLFDLKSPNMSRREILYRIAEKWGLEMSIALDSEGRPEIVRVIGQGDQMQSGTSFPPPAESDIPGGRGF